MKSRAFAAVVAIGAGLAAGPSLAADAVTLGIPVVSLTVTPIYIADEMGYWSKAGLDMKFPLIPGVGVNNALAAGSVDFAFSSGPTMIRGNARDQRSVAIATATERVQLEVVLAKAAADAAGITANSPMDKKAQALKGRKIAVDSINSVVHSFLRFVARKGGIDPDRDIVVTSMAGPAALAALKSGAIEGFTMSMPWPIIPVHDGTAIRLASGPRGDFPELQPFLYTLILARPDYCDKSPANTSICQRLVAGMAQAHAYIHDHPKEAIELVKKRIPVDVNPAVFQEGFDLVRASTPRSPRIIEAALAKAQDYMITTGMMAEAERVKTLTAVYSNKYVQ